MRYVGFDVVLDIYCMLGSVLDPKDPKYTNLGHVL